MRGFLAQILEGLPCGVLVFDARARLRVINPEARRLLTLDPSWLPEEGMALPAVIDRLLAESSSKSPAAEREWTFDDPAGARYLGITQAQVTGEGQRRQGSDLDPARHHRGKTPRRERETARRNQALAEIATVLAHEIRNPLGSLELFAGLLADATRGHFRSQAMGGAYSGRAAHAVPRRSTTFLQFHSQPCPEPIPTQLDRLLRETVEFLGPLARQRGMQIKLDNRAGKSHAACGPAPAAAGISESGPQRVPRDVAGRLAAS